MSAGDGKAKDFTVFADGTNDGGAEHEELRVVMRGVAGIEQVFALVGGHGPVVVLAAAVDAGERFFVEQADEAVFVGRAPHHVHDHVLVIGGEIAVFEQGRKFDTGWGRPRCGGF